MRMRIGSRSSPLAVKQVEEIRRLFPGISFEASYIDTLGDKDKLTPIYQVEGEDFFTREIDQALLRGEIDLGLHSSKDLPEVLPKGLALVFESGSLSPYDCLVSRNHFKFSELSEGSRVGISSARRKEQIKLLRSDLQVVDIRGNIQERIALIDSGKIDALIVAHAALIRLGLEQLIDEIFPLTTFKAHPKQGSLSLLAKEELCEKLKFILSAQARETGSLSVLRV